MGNNIDRTCTLKISFPVAAKFGYLDICNLKDNMKKYMGFVAIDDGICNGYEHTIIFVKIVKGGNLDKRT